MGISSDAILFYGCVWTDEYPLPDEVAEMSYSLSKDSPIEVGFHCSIEYSMPYIAIKESHLTAYRGHAVRVPLEGLAQANFDRWHSQLIEFATTYNLDLDEKDQYDGKPLVQGPDWFLVSYMG